MKFNKQLLIILLITSLTGGSFYSVQAINLKKGFSYAWNGSKIVIGASLCLPTVASLLLKSNKSNRKLIATNGSTISNVRTNGIVVVKNGKKFNNIQVEFDTSGNIKNANKEGQKAVKDDIIKPVQNSINFKSLGLNALGLFLISWGIKGLSEGLKKRKL